MSRFWKLTRFWPVILLAGFILAYISIIRPWHMRWGATDQEVAMALPGDALVAPDANVSTRAITIHAPVATVWAWLVQTGQNRGGDLALFGLLIPAEWGGVLVGIASIASAGPRPGSGTIMPFSTACSRILMNVCNGKI